MNFETGQAVKDLRKPGRTGRITAIDGARCTIEWNDGRTQNYATATAHGTLFDADDSKPARKAAKKSTRSKVAKKKAKKAKRKRS